MSPRQSTNKPEARSSKGEGSATGQDSAARRRFEEVQLARLSARLRDAGNVREVVRVLGSNPDQYLSKLAKQYADLSGKKREPLSFTAQTLSPRLAGILNNIGDIFNWWETVLAPNAAVELVQTPTSTDTGGSIGADIYQGSLALGGEIWNGDAEEQWWVNTWQYIVPLPTTPSAGSMSYRFDVGASLTPYRQDVVSGSIYVYVTVATTSDLNTTPVNFGQPASSQFAIEATLPAGGVPPIITGSVQVSGDFPLVSGGDPAIGILIGLIVSIADGDLLILPGEYSQITLAPPNATMPSDLGKIQYRRDQSTWVNAVAARFEA
jgi:hypothetical protein